MATKVQKKPNFTELTELYFLFTQNSIAKLMEIPEGELPHEHNRSIVQRVLRIYDYLKERQSPVDCIRRTLNNSLSDARINAYDRKTAECLSQVRELFGGYIEICLGKYD